MLLTLLTLCCVPDTSDPDPGPAQPARDEDVFGDSVFEPDSGAPDDDCVEGDPEGTLRSIRIWTDTSPSWVAWAEVEFSGSRAGGDVGALISGATLSGSSSDGLDALRDGDRSTIWNAGDFAPQWIQLDFGEPITPTVLQLTVAQTPSGDTRHVVEIAQSCGDFDPVHMWSEDTSNGQTLRWNAAADEACDTMDLNLVLKKTSAPCWDCEFWFDPMDVEAQRPRLEVRWSLDGVSSTSVFQDGPSGVDGPLTSTFIMGADALLGPGSCASGDDACRANFLHKLRTQVWDGVHYYNGLVHTDLSAIPCEAEIEEAQLWLWIHEERGLAGADKTSTAAFYRGVRDFDVETVHGLRYGVGADGADLLWTTPGGDIGESVLEIEATRDFWDRGFHKGSPEAWFDFTDHVQDLQFER
ncbi:MAG TPA: hypothetical protein QGF58_11680 [Myxococcota bacterium]|nr:hypothetical protein [Myxococcota bacterium]